METVLEQVSEISSGEQNEASASISNTIASNSQNNKSRYVRARKGRDVWTAISTFGGKDERRRMRKMKNISKAYMYGFGSLVLLLLNRAFDVMGTFADSTITRLGTWMVILSLGTIVARATSSTFREPWYLSGFFVVPLFAWCACFSRQKLGTNDFADVFLFLCATFNSCFAIFESRKPKSFRYATPEQRRLLGLPELTDEDLEFDRANLPKSMDSSNSKADMSLRTTTTTTTPSLVTKASSASSFGSSSGSQRKSMNLTPSRLVVTPVQSGSRWQSTSLGLETDISIISNVSDLDGFLDVRERQYDNNMNTTPVMRRSPGTTPAVLSSGRRRRGGGGGGLMMIDDGSSSVGRRRGTSRSSRRRRDKTPEGGRRRRKNRGEGGRNGMTQNLNVVMRDEDRIEETRHAERRLEDEGISISDLDRWANNLRMFLAKELSGMFTSLSRNDEELNRDHGVDSDLLSFRSERQVRFARFRNVSIEELMFMGRCDRSVFLSRSRRIRLMIERARLMRYFGSAKGTDRRYVKKRLKQLCSDGYLSDYIWDRRSSNGQCTTDFNVMIHAFAAYMDNILGGNDEDDVAGRTFFDRYVEINIIESRTGRGGAGGNKDQDNGTSRSSRRWRKPRLKMTREGHVEIIDAQGDPWPVVPGSRNLFYAIVLFLWNIKKYTGGRLGGFDFREGLLRKVFVRNSIGGMGGGSSRIMLY